MRNRKFSKVLVTQLCPTLCDPMDCSPPGSFVHGDSLGKNTRVGCHALLQGIFPTQGSNPPASGLALSLERQEIHQSRRYKQSFGILYEEKIH